MKHASGRNFWTYRTGGDEFMVIGKRQDEGRDSVSGFLDMEKK